MEQGCCVGASGGAPALVMLCHEGYDLYLPTWNLHHTLTLLMLFVLQHCTLYIILSSSGTGKVDLLNFSFVLDSEDQRVQQENVRSCSHFIYIFKKDI